MSMERDPLEDDDFELNGNGNDSDKNKQVAKTAEEEIDDDDIAGMLNTGAGKDKLVKNSDKGIDEIDGSTIGHILTLLSLENAYTADPANSTLGRRIKTPTDRKLLRDKLALISEYLHLDEVFHDRKGRIVFLGDIPDDLVDELVGYENYVDTRVHDKPVNIGIKYAPVLYYKWSDSQLINLAKQEGVTLEWLSPGVGEWKYKYGLVFNSTKFNGVNGEGDIYEAKINNHEFSFHQVYISKINNVLVTMNALARRLDELIRMEDKMSRISKEDMKIYSENGVNIVEKTSHDLVNEYCTNVIPQNTRGYVMSELLDENMWHFMVKHGTGLADLMTEGGYEEEYLNVHAMMDLLKKVIGERNYVFVTGTLNKISIASGVEVNGFKYDKGTAYIVRGVYLDRLGNMKIGQIVTSTRAGAEKVLASSAGATIQLLKRKMVFETFRIFKSIPTIKKKDQIIKRAKNTLNEHKEYAEKVLGVYGQKMLSDIQNHGNDFTILYERNPVPKRKYITTEGLIEPGRNTGVPMIEEGKERLRREREEEKEEVVRDREEQRMMLENPELEQPEVRNEQECDDEYETNK